MFQVFSYLLLGVYLAGTLYMLGLMVYLMIVHQPKKEPGNPVVPLRKKWRFRRAA